jgi:hypothetical protein
MSLVAPGRIAKHVEGRRIDHVNNSVSITNREVDATSSDSDLGRSSFALFDDYLMLFVFEINVEIIPVTSLCSSLKCGKPEH